MELGEYDISGPTEHMATMQRKVERVFIHKDYHAPTFENDIAILELQNKIERKPHIVPICLPREDDVFEDRTAIVSGWGRLKYGEFGAPNWVPNWMTNRVPSRSRITYSKLEPTCHESSLATVQYTMI